MRISIIIPTYQEAACIGDLVAHIRSMDTQVEYELLVSDGGSSDQTQALAEAAGAKVVQAPKPGRAVQMNYAASVAKGDILYFLHADAFPPPNFLECIEANIERGYDFGHFRQRILAENKWVRINSFLSRLSGLAASGGDQSLFIKRTFFNSLGGYKQDMPIMEDYELVQRARKKGKWIKVPIYLKVLDRKYAYNSFLRVNLVNFFIFSAYRLGVAPYKLKRWYTKWIKGPRYQDLK